MESPDILMPLNTYLTIKSASILKTVSKLLNEYIYVRKSFYKIFKSLNCSQENIIMTLVFSDKAWYDYDKNANHWYSITHHKHHSNLLRYIENTQVYTSVIEFEEINDTLEFVDSDFVYDVLQNHCELYIDNYLIQQILVEMCIIKYNIMSYFT